MKPTRLRGSNNEAYQNDTEAIMKPTRLLSAITCAWEVSLGGQAINVSSRCEKLSLQRLIHCRQCKGGLSLPEKNELVISGNPQTSVPRHGNAFCTCSVHHHELFVFWLTRLDFLPSIKRKSYSQQLTNDLACHS